MIAVVAIWSFVSFVFFKVCFDFAYYKDISIVAALLLGIGIGAVIFAASGVYAHGLLKYNWTPGRVTATVGQLLRPTIIPMLLFAMAYGTVARLVIFGFSKSLNKEIRVFTRYGDDLDKTFIVFAAIISAPILLHYVMCIAETYRTANKFAAKRNIPPPAAPRRRDLD